MIALILTLLPACGPPREQTPPLTSEAVDVADAFVHDTLTGDCEAAATLQDDPSPQLLPLFCTRRWVVTDFHVSGGPHVDGNKVTYRVRAVETYPGHSRIRATYDVFMIRSGSRWLVHEWSFQVTYRRSISSPDAQG